MGTGVKSLTLATKITIMVSIIILLSTIPIGVFAVRQYQGGAVGMHQARAVFAAQGIASLIDPSLFLLVMETGEKNEYYEELQRQLNRAKADMGLLFLFMGVADDRGNFTAFAEGLLPSDTRTVDLGDVIPAEAGIFPPELLIAQQGTAAAADIIPSGVDDNYVVAAYAPVFNANGMPIGIVGVNVLATEVFTGTSAFAWSITALVAAIILILIWVPILWVRKYIRRPVGALSQAFGNIANGRTDIQLPQMPNDEIGELAQNTKHLARVIRDMVDDLSNTHEQYIKIGDIHHQIDNSKYQNSFKEVIEHVNGLTAQVTTDIKNFSDMIGRIGEGDFNLRPDYSVWVGEWSFVPKTVDNLVKNLNSVTIEVNEMINSIVEKGDLSFKIDESKYKGDWRKIMEGLNGITTSVNEPLGVIAIAIRAMRAGNFSIDDIDKTLIAAGLNPDIDSYAGEFGEIILEFAEAVGATDSYINEIKDVLTQMANGDLRNEIAREYVGSFDIIKRSVNNITKQLHSTMSEIASSSEHVLTGAKEIALASAHLANGSAEQAVSVDELNNSINTIRLLIQQNTENATTASDLSEKSTANANVGNIAVEQMLEAMEQIKHSSNSISGINKVIQDIAFQTNLLALNASVEAARAGEHGKGFAVVADEVRTLAGRSQAAAAETTQLIQDSINRVEAGSAIALSTAEALRIIVSNVSEVSNVLSNVSASSIKQEEAAKTTTEGIDAISDVAQSNSASSEETAAASEELNSQAEILRQLVSFFKL